MASHKLSDLRRSLILNFNMGNDGNRTASQMLPISPRAVQFSEY